MRCSYLFSVVAAVLLAATGSSAEGSLDAANVPSAEAKAGAAEVELAETSSGAATSPEMEGETDPPSVETVEPAPEAVAVADPASGQAADVPSDRDSMPLAATDDVVAGGAGSIGGSETSGSLEGGSETLDAAETSAAPEAKDRASAVAALAMEPEPVVPGVVLGPIGIDDLGRTGRLHTVARGDTLWDLAAAYLGTPWVWPSVWIDNDDIANPHRIEPGDKIWITANEMRMVSDAEAQSFIDAAPQQNAAVDMEASEETESAPAAPVASVEDDASQADEAATLEAFPVAVPGEAARSFDAERQITVSRREAMGFVSAEDLAGASTIVDSPVVRHYLAEGDPVYLGLGEGDVEVGDQFSIFQVIEEVRDPETHRIVGHHVDPLGWIEVRELTGDTSVGEIRTSYAEIERGAHIMRRPQISARVTVRSTPEVIEGAVIFLPAERTLMADGGYVYLNRGEFHGVEVGTELEVFESGEIMLDTSRQVDVQTPDHVVARLVVVTVQPDSSVAFVLSSDRELEVGDRIRPTLPKLAQR